MRPGPASRFGLVALAVVAAGAASSCLLITDRFGLTAPPGPGRTFGQLPDVPAPAPTPRLVPSFPACIDDLVVLVDGQELACDQPDATLAKLRSGLDRDGKGTVRSWYADGGDGTRLLRNGEIGVYDSTRDGADVIGRVVEQELGGQAVRKDEIPIDLYRFDVDRVPTAGFEGALRADEMWSQTTRVVVRYDFSSRACFLTYLACARLAPRLNGGRGGVGINWVIPFEPVVTPAPTPDPTLSPS